MSESTKRSYRAALPAVVTPTATVPINGSNLPRRYSRSRFVGRRKEIQKIMDALASDDWILTIDSMGGVGKTTLALEVAHRCKEGCAENPYIPPFTGYIWTSAERRPDFCLDRVIKEILDVLCPLDEVLHLTSGHPYFLQLVYDTLIEHCNDLRRNYVTIQDVRDVWDEITDQGRTRLLFVWRESSREEKAVLAALANLLRSQQQVTAAGIVEHLVDRIGGLTEHVLFDLVAVSGALERLINRELVKEAPDEPPPMRLQPACTLS